MALTAAQTWRRESQRLGIQEVAPLARFVDPLQDSLRNPRCGRTRRGTSPGFYVSSHATVLDVPLLTRDIHRHRAYSPTLRLAAAAPDPRHPSTAKSFVRPAHRHRTTKTIPPRTPPRRSLAAPRPDRPRPRRTGRGPPGQDPVSDQEHAGGFRPAAGRLRFHAGSDRHYHHPDPPGPLRHPAGAYDTQNRRYGIDVGGTTGRMAAGAYVPMGVGQADGILTLRRAIVAARYYPAE
jgi:hypothetical protein